MKYIIGLGLLLAPALGLAVGVSDNDLIEVTNHQGTGDTKLVACERAQAKASKNGNAASDCICDETPSGGHLCKSTSTQRLTLSSSKPIAVAPKQAQPNSKSKPANCGAMIKYRDTKLAQDVDFSIKHYTAASKSIELLGPLKKEALEQRSTLPTVDAALKLTLALKTTASAIGDLLGLSPATDTATISASKFAITILSEQTNLTVAVLTDEVDSWVHASALSLVPVIGSGLKASYNLYDNLKALSAADLDGKSIAAQNFQNIEGLEKMLRKQEAILKDSGWQTRTLNKVRADIDQACG